jgi:hypothetical protein
MDRITKIPNTIFQTITSQDFQQKTIMIISVSLELYRVMVSCLLLLFIPQKCDDHACTIEENLDYNREPNYRNGIILNYVTAAIFIILYITEVRREEKLIKLLEVNPNISTDNYSVKYRVNVFQEYKKKQLYNVVIQYKYASYFTMIIFITNTIYSWNAIYVHSLGNQTILNFVTNILFMISKLSNVLVIINTDDHTYFSAYLNTKVQFNDIDPREVDKIKRLSKDNEGNKGTVIRLFDEGGGFEIIEIENDV